MNISTPKNKLPCMFSSKVSLNKGKCSNRIIHVEIPINSVRYVPILDILKKFVNIKCITIYYFPAVKGIEFNGI